MNNRYLIIGILCVVIALLCCGIAYLMLNEQTEYITVHTVANGSTLEIPDDMVVKSNNTDNGIVVLENDNTIVIFFNSADKGLAPLMAFADIKVPIFGNEFSGNTTIKDPTVAGCSLTGECNAVYLGNNMTHDNIIIISQKKDIVDHIVSSIKWVVLPSDSSDADTSSADSQPAAYAYKSDGTPMYSEDEVNDYMLNKYGMVDYHVGENGYIDMDEPGFDDAGNYIGTEEYE